MKTASTYLEKNDDSRSRSAEESFVMKFWLLFQRALAITATIVLSPVFLALYLCVKLGSPGPFLFTQPRRGLNEKVFKLYKIRSMRQGSEKGTALGVNNSDYRVTWIGRFMRATKLDELPQLWNIAKGDMTLVGPRPIPLALDAELADQIPGFMMRYQVKPGLTSIGQICIADNALGDELVEDWKTRFEGELHYIRNRSVTYDVIMIAFTCLYVFKILTNRDRIESPEGQEANPKRKELSIPQSPVEVGAEKSATSILGVPIANLDYEQTAETILEWGKSREHRYISVCNAHSVTSSKWNPDLRNALLDADLNTADGMPLVWMQRLLGHQNASRVYGPTLMLKTLEKLDKAGLRIALYGGHPDRLPKLEAFIRENFPKVTIAESISPPFRALTFKERAEYELRLTNSRAHVIWVGIGCPKQELWMQENSSLIPGVMIGVGAAFDFHAGAVRQAPPFLQKMGLEWLYRLYCEPRRLFKRYATTNPAFIVLSAGQLAARCLKRVLNPFQLNRR